jgi:hypothetical protein
MPILPVNVRQSMSGAIFSTCFSHSSLLESFALGALIDEGVGEVMGAAISNAGMIKQFILTAIIHRLLAFSIITIL